MKTEKEIKEKVISQHEKSIKDLKSYVSHIKLEVENLENMLLHDSHNDPDEAWMKNMDAESRIAYAALKSLAVEGSAKTILRDAQEILYGVVCGRLLGSFRKEIEEKFMVQLQDFDVLYHPDSNGIYSPVFVDAIMTNVDKRIDRTDLEWVLKHTRKPVSVNMMIEVCNQCASVESGKFSIELLPAIRMIDKIAATN